MTGIEVLFIFNLATLLTYIFSYFWNRRRLYKLVGFGKVSSHISAQIKYAQIFEDICEDVCEDSLTEIKNLNYFN